MFKLIHSLIIKKIKTSMKHLIFTKLAKLSQEIMTPVIQLRGVHWHSYSENLFGNLNISTAQQSHCIASQQQTFPTTQILSIGQIREEQHIYNETPTVRIDSTAESINIHF